MPAHPVRFRQLQLLLMLVSLIGLLLVATARVHAQDRGRQRDHRYSTRTLSDGRPWPTGQNPSPAVIWAKMMELGRKHQVPPELLAAMAMVESTMQHYGGDGQVIHNRDELTAGSPDPPGLGMMQLTGATARLFDVDRLITDPWYNLECGISILKEKWRSHSRFAGSSQPDPYVLENWFAAVTGYNSYRSGNPYFDKVQQRLRALPAPCRSSEFTLPGDAIHGWQFDQPYTALRGNRFIDAKGEVHKAPTHLSILGTGGQSNWEFDGEEFHHRILGFRCPVPAATWTVTAGDDARKHGSDLTEVAFLHMQGKSVGAIDVRFAPDATGDESLASWRREFGWGFPTAEAEPIGNQRGRSVWRIAHNGQTVLVSVIQHGDWVLGVWFRLDAPGQQGECVRAISRLVTSRADIRIRDAEPAIAAGCPVSVEVPNRLWSPVCIEGLGTSCVGLERKARSAFVAVGADRSNPDPERCADVVATRIARFMSADRREMTVVGPTTFRSGWLSGVTTVFTGPDANPVMIEVNAFERSGVTVWLAGWCHAAHAEAIERELRSVRSSLAWLDETPGEQLDRRPRRSGTLRLNGTDAVGGSIPIAPPSSRADNPPADSQINPQQEPTADFPTGTPEFERFIEIVRMVVPSGHHALRKDSAAGVFEALNNDYRDKVSRMLDAFRQRASGNERELLSRLQDVTGSD